MTGGAVLGFALGMAAVVLLRALVQHRPRDVRDPDPPEAANRRACARTHEAATARAGVGRAVLRAYRIAGDVRAIGRGPGAYGRRLARRAVFRSVRRW